jgi:hypothetical protein
VRFIAPLFLLLSIQNASTMKYLLNTFLLFLTLAAFAKDGREARIYAYPMPAIYHASQVFSLQASGQNVPVIDYNPKYDYAHFSMSNGRAEIVITLLHSTGITDFNISPKKLAIPARREGDKLIFTLNKGEYLIVKVNQLKELVIAADAEEQNKPASSGKGIFNVSSAKYKAIGDGKTLTTQAIQQAIDDASAYHKGVVYIPAGVYAIGNLKLKSNMQLYLEGGAVLLFTGNPNDYKVSARKSSQNRNITWWIYTDGGAHNIKLYGRGTLDGNGKFATNKENNIGNHILAIFGTQNFVLDGLLIRDSGAWGVIPTRCKDVTFKNFKIFNRFDMGENDGMDVMESENVKVKHGIGIALDDPFSTKTWEQNTDLCCNWPGSPQPQNNVVFEDLLSWTYCYAYKIGQGVMQPQSNISFKNCVVYDAAVGIGIHHKWGTSYVHHVTFDHIDIEKLSYKNDDNRVWGAFFMQNGDKKGSGPIADIKISNINIYDLGKSPGKIKGVSDAAPVSNVTFKHIMLPGSGIPAGDLKEMNMTDTINCKNIRVIQ